ncbi:MAG: hypothetical protein IPK74_18265 [Deltaproteobacteria bacterium]|nr:hypothetical protein [Deltaproteobacteria bacterium]
MSRSRGLWLVLAAALLSACAGAARREVAAQSRSVSRAVHRGDARATHAHVLPAAQPWVDDATLLGAQRRAWAKRLRRPVEITPRAGVLLTPELAAEASWTKDGWRFDADPSAAYAQDTPEHAIAALVRASRAGRWDVLLRLAPRRYRVGLSAEDLAAAWTEGEQAAALREARDRLARVIGDPVPHDDHDARLDLGDGHIVRLEREDGGWVVVDF